MEAQPRCGKERNFIHPPQSRASTPKIAELWARRDLQAQAVPPPDCHRALGWALSLSPFGTKTPIQVGQLPQTHLAGAAGVPWALFGVGGVSYQLWGLQHTGDKASQNSAQKGTNCGTEAPLLPSCLQGFISWGKREESSGARSPESGTLL